MRHNFDIFQLITTIGIFLVVLYIITMFSNKRGIFTAKVFFSLFLVSISLIIGDSGLILYTGLYHYIPHFAKIPTVVQLLDGPFIYLYLMVVAHGKEKLNRYHLLHFIPFVIFIFLYSPILFQSGDAKIEYVYAWLNGTIGKKEMILEGVLFGIILAHIVIYLVLSLRYIGIFEQKILLTFGNKRLFVSWLKLFICFFIVTIVITGIVTVGVVAFDIRFSVVYRFLPVFATISMCVVVFLALIQSDIHFGIAINGQKRNVNLQRLLSPSEVEHFVGMIDKVMKEDKLFKKANLGLPDLADKVGISRNQMSFILNSFYRENFYDFVNRHRIEEVKRILKESGDADINYLNIGFAVGFNSKTTFNASFKKIANMTPSDYRKAWLLQKKTG